MARDNGQSPIELASPGSGAGTRPGSEDQRPHMPDPPPVKLVSIQDVTLPTPAGLERRLDALYRDILGFRRRLPQEETDGGPVYAAENHDLRFFVLERPPEREDCRPIGIVTPRLAQIIESLEAWRIEYESVRGLVAGQDGLLMRDPGGNWLALLPLREIR